MAGAGIVLLAGGAYFAFPSRSPRVPELATHGFDPAVAKLIRETVEQVRRVPRSGALWGKLGSVLMHYEFVEEARFSFEQAEKFSPTDPRWPYLCGVLLMNRQPEAALARLERAARLSRGHPDTPALRLAQFLSERGRHAEAERQFQLLLQARPDHSLALLGLARIRQAQGKLMESTGLLSDCLDDPHTAKSAWAMLATVQQALGHAAEADAATRRSASLPPEPAWPDPFSNDAAAYRIGRNALIEDATALMDNGRLDEAILILSRIARDYPQDDECWYLTGWALNQQRRSAEAERALRECLRLSPDSPKGQSQLAIALLGQQRYEEAIEVLESALRLKPTWRELHSNLGYACVQLGREDDAIRHFRDALFNDPNHVPSCTALADLLSRRGQSEEARRLLRQALELNPSDQRARALLRSMEENR
jgi:tetratricopeptide (TPR) repeat protein